ncbi:MAG: uroporphyrinogen decarboxylase family protein [Chloroflexi bacterium]|nr:uroporphyrinogen decarboxylase family protein [Chloroflexota bacterium]MCL5111059.1 uroporphyrinogen decarboxylase family protein [Chloroflexota bacterium]
MTHRERALAALSHQEPDRVPIDLSAAAGDFITIPAYRALLDYLGFSGRPIATLRRDMQYAVVDEDILRRFDVDFRRVDLGAPDHGADEALPDDTYRDAWGILRRRPPGGMYYDLVPGSSPLREATSIGDLDHYPWPDPEDPGLFRGLRERAQRVHEETDYAVVLCASVEFFGLAALLRGWEAFYMDLAADQEFAAALMDRCLEYHLTVVRRALAEAGDFADVVVASRDDFGAMDRPLVRPETFRKLILPRLRRAFGLYRELTPAKRFMHCDGAVRDLIPDMLDAGLEALNPIQVSAAGMGDTRRLKQDFGDRLTFWGGIDTHHVLPLGSPEDVCREVQGRILDLAPGGGYVGCSVHSLQADVPPANMVAMFEALAEYGRYPLKG